MEALAHHDAGRTEQALDAYDAALAVAPSLGVSLLAPRAAALEELGRLAEAVDAAAAIPEVERWRLEVSCALSCWPLLCRLWLL